MNPSDRHHTKAAALHEFERWAHTYDRSILQWMLFRPTYEHMLEEAVRWRSDCALPPAFQSRDREGAVCAAGEHNEPLPHGRGSEKDGRGAERDGRGVEKDGRGVEKDGRGVEKDGRGSNRAAHTPFEATHCGTGSWAAMVFATELAGRVVGLDYSPEMCRRALRKARDVGVGGLSFVNGDSEHLPFGDASFDLVTCSHSFHHYPHQQDVIREMRRVLRPGGRLMLVDGFRDNIIGWFVYDVFVTRAEGAVYHVPWSRMREMFQAAGFADVRQRKFNIWAPALMTIGTVA